MKETEQQIALCEWAGWQVAQDTDGAMVLRSPDGKRIRSDYEPTMTLESFSHHLPNTSSLDVLHGMEKRLVEQNLWQQYMQKLSERVCADADEPLNYDIETQWGMMHATATQRRIALLKTLNLWKEDV